MNNAAFIYEDIPQKSLFHIKWWSLCCCESESATVQSTADVTAVTDVWVSQESLWKHIHRRKKTELNMLFFLTWLESLVTSPLQIQVTLPLVLRNDIIKWHFFQSGIFVVVAILQFWMSVNLRRIHGEWFTITQHCQLGHRKQLSPKQLDVEAWQESWWLFTVTGFETTQQIHRLLRAQHQFGSKL